MSTLRYRAPAPTLTVTVATFAIVAWVLSFSGCAGTTTPAGAESDSSQSEGTEAATSLGSGELGGQDGPDDENLEQARADYKTYCVICHGEEGEGYAADSANALNNPNFLASVTDPALYEAIAHGRAETPMSAWSVNRGGPLSQASISGIVRLIRSWSTIDTVDTEALEIDGEALRGLGVWKAFCMDCHGEWGEGGKYLSVATPNFLDYASDGYLKYAVMDGRPGTPMLAYGDTLMPREIDDVVALIRMWSWVVTPEHDGLDEKVLNLDGDDPDFSADPRFVPADDVMEAMEAETKMLILDARPASDSCFALMLPSIRRNSGTEGGWGWAGISP
ncbi:MAG: c-type cytochrome [Nannocystaceae bacterium]